MSVSLYGSGNTVIQAVQSVATSQNSTTSTSYVATPFSATITPQSTNSKILVLVNGNCYQSGSGSNLYTSIYRGGSSIYAQTALYFATGIANAITTFSLIYLDSRATTSATTYTLYFKVVSGTGYINGDNANPTSITLLEISGS